MADIKKSIHDDFFNAYRGRYSQYWVRNWGLIPQLPTSYDNANSIYELVAWLQNAFKHLLDDFVNLELEFEEFKNALIELLLELIPKLIREYVSSEEFINIINEIVNNYFENNWKEIIDQILVDITNIKQDITNIYSLLDEINSEINNIYNIIGSLEGNNYIFMNPNTDFDVVFYNGFYTESNNIQIGYIETKDRYKLIYQGRVSDGTILQNANLNSVLMAHDQPVSSVPESRIFGVNFKGSFAFLNNYINIPITLESPTGIWNINSTVAGQRLSWNAHINLDDEQSGQKMLAYWVSYADGYNTQLATRYEGDLSSVHINYRVENILYKPPTFLKTKEQQISNLANAIKEYKIKTNSNN